MSNDSLYSLMYLRIRLSTYGKVCLFSAARPRMCPCCIEFLGLDGIPTVCCGLVANADHFPPRLSEIYFWIGLPLF
jgi:hypothetical protein